MVSFFDINESTIVLSVVSPIVVGIIVVIEEVVLTVVSVAGVVNRVVTVEVTFDAVVVLTVVTGVVTVEVMLDAVVSDHIFSSSFSSKVSGDAEKRLGRQLMNVQEQRKALSERNIKKLFQALLISTKFLLTPIIGFLKTSVLYD